MEAKELRIGNWVSINKPITEEFALFVKIQSQDILECDKLGTNFQPIPLTPEILEKAGFEKVVNGVALRVLDGYVFIGSYFSRFPLTLEIDHHRMPLHHIKYLHQLQNLYFALTGEELEIEL